MFDFLREMGELMSINSTIFFGLCISEKAIGLLELSVLLFCKYNGSRFMMRVMVGIMRGRGKQSVIGVCISMEA